MALSPGDKPIFTDIGHRDFQTAINRPFEKTSAGGTKLPISEVGDSYGRKHVNFQRLIFQEANVQDNHVITHDSGGVTEVNDVTSDGGILSVRKGIGAALDNAKHDIFKNAFQFMVNPHTIKVVYKKDVSNKVVKNSVLRCPKVHAGLNRNVQFFGNQVTEMTINGYTGVAEKSGMISMLIDLGSFGYWWWVDDRQAKGFIFGGSQTAGSSMFKKIGFLPVRWRIFHYTCDTLSPWDPDTDTTNNANTIRDFQGIGSKTRKEKKRLYYGRIVDLTLSQNVETTGNHEFSYEMKIHLDMFDSHLGKGDAYITGI